MSGNLSLLRKLIIVVSMLLTGAASTARAADDGLACANDGTIRVCVMSAAVTDLNQGQGAIQASIVLQITNIGQYPIQAALSANGVAFTPQDSVSIRGSVNQSGIGICQQACRDPDRYDELYSTLVPGHPVVAQISLMDFILSRSARDQMQLASHAFFSATFSLVERGHQRYVPIPLPMFKFSFTRG